MTGPHARRSHPTNTGNNNEGPTMTDLQEYTADEIDMLVATGRAQRWTLALGGQVPLAAKVDDTWFVVYTDSEHYSPAVPALSHLFDVTPKVLAAADRSIAAADSPLRR